MLLFAETDPDDVAGVVLIDSSHPRQDEALAEIPGLVAIAEKDAAGVEAMAARAEVGVIGAEDVLALAPRGLPLALRYQWAALFAQPHSLAETTPAHELQELGLTPEDADRFDAIWTELQQDHANRSADSRLIVAENSTHSIYLDEPDIVVQAIRDLTRTG